MIIHKRYSWSCHLYKWNPIGWEILKILKILPSFLEMNLIVHTFCIFCKRCCFVIFCSALLGPIHLAFGQNKLSTKDILKLQMWSDHWRKGSFKQKKYFFTKIRSKENFSCFCYVCKKRRCKDLLDLQRMRMSYQICISSDSLSGRQWWGGIAGYGTDACQMINICSPSGDSENMSKSSEN